MLALSLAILRLQAVLLRTATLLVLLLSVTTQMTTLAVTSVAVL
jgi:hypothetical protein